MNAADRRAVIAEVSASMVGASMLMAGLLLTISHGGATVMMLTVTACAILYRWQHGEPLYPALLSLGALWLIVGLLFWAYT